MKTIIKTLQWPIYCLTYPALIIYLRNSSRSRAVIYSDQGNILVVKGWHGNNKWLLPGGGIKKNEEPGQGARREVREETGLDLPVNSFKFIKSLPYNHLGIKQTLSLFRVQITNQPTIKKLWYEVSEADWINPNQLNSENSTHDLLLCLKNLLQ